MNILIPGLAHGKMAHLLHAKAGEKGYFPVPFYSENPPHAASMKHGSPVIAIHFGSGRELPALIEYCTTINVPILNGSTGQTFPDKLQIPIVDAPNLALPILAVLSAVLPAAARTLLSVVDHVNIRESHQAAKKTVPGTAKKICEILGKPAENIFSIRDPEVQRELGISPKNLDWHAWHLIEFKSSGVTIEINTKVDGGDVYAEGALTVAARMIDIQARLRPGVMSITDFINNHAN